MYSWAGTGDDCAKAHADVTSKFGGTSRCWMFTATEDTSLVSPTLASAEVRFYVTGLSNDSFAIRIYDGSGWSPLETFDSGNAPPATLTIKQYTVTSMLDTAAKISGAQMEFRGVSKTGGEETITIYVDEVPLCTEGALSPTSLEQDHYRIGEDTPLAAMAWFADTDTAPTGDPQNYDFRVRFQLYSDGGGAKTWQPQLEWSATSGSGYAAVPITSGVVPWYVTDTTQFANADALATGNFALGTGTKF